MRKFASVLLMCILLFNLVGYRFVADYMQERSDAKLEDRLDHDQYDESQLIEVKVPLSMPYQTSWAEYERYDGEIEINGITYKYVKRKLYDDTLYLKCIPNTQKMRLQAAKDNFFKGNNDISQNTDSKKSGNSKSVSFKKLLSEYTDYPSLFKASLQLPTKQSCGLYLLTKIITSPHLSPEQPPDFLVA